MSEVSLQNYICNFMDKTCNPSTTETIRFYYHYCCFHSFYFESNIRISQPPCVRDYSPEVWVQSGVVQLGVISQCLWFVLTCYQLDMLKHI